MDPARPRGGRAAGAGCRSGASAFDQPDVAGARPLGRFLRLELDALPFAQQLEDGAAHGRAVEEMLDTSFVADEPEALVDEEPCNCAGRHTRDLRRTCPRGQSPG